MITVIEINDETELKEILKTINKEPELPARYFIGKEDGAVFGAVRLTYDKGIKIDYVLTVDGCGFDYYDFLVRSALNSVRGMGRLKVYTFINDGYFLSLGFKNTGGAYETSAEDIVFPSCCDCPHAKKCGK